MLRYCKFVWVQKNPSLNMEQGQVISITTICLVFWVTLAANRIRRYFPPQVWLSFIGKEKLYKLKWSSLFPLLQKGCHTGHTSCLLHLCLVPSCNIDYMKDILKLSTRDPEKFLVVSLLISLFRITTGHSVFVIPTAHLWQHSPFSSPIMIRNKAGYIWNEDLFSESN